MDVSQSADVDIDLNIDHENEESSTNQGVGGGGGGSGDGYDSEGELINALEQIYEALNGFQNLLLLATTDDNASVVAKQLKVPAENVRSTLENLQEKLRKNSSKKFNGLKANSRRTLVR